MNISNVFVQGATYYPQKKALIYGDKSYTYGEFNAVIDQVALYLRGLRVTRGHRVSLYLRNCPEWLMFYYGAARLGATSVCIASAYKREEMTGLINDSLSSLVVTCEELLPQFPERKEIPHVKDIVVVERDETLLSIIGKKKGRDPQLERVECEEDDVAAILYTGGTTGVPKGAMLTHRNLLYSALNVCYHEKMVPEDIGLCFMPLNHVFAQCHIMNSIFYSYATLVLMKGFDMDVVISSVPANTVTRFYAVPEIPTHIKGVFFAERLLTSRPPALFLNISRHIVLRIPAGSGHDHLFLSFLLAPARATKPEPKRNMVPGTGTGAGVNRKALLLPLCVP